MSCTILMNNLAHQFGFNPPPDNSQKRGLEIHLGNFLQYFHFHIKIKKFQFLKIKRIRQRYAETL